MTIIRKNSLGLLLCTLLIGALFLSGAEASRKVYPLSLSELVEVLSGWFVHRGFEVRRASYKTGQVKLGAVKAGEKWEVILKPHSPLATEVEASFMTNETPEHTRVQKLWDHILAYIKSPSSGLEDPNRVIPNPVLSQIESAVCIDADLGDEHYQFSGFIVDKEGLIISTAHLPAPVQSFTVTLYDGREVKGRLVKVDRHRDLALVSVDLKFDTAISLAKGRNLVGMGEKLYSVGCPIDLSGSVYSGSINGPPRRSNNLPLWQIDMKIYPGSSGSPVFDAQGRLVAVVKGRYWGIDSVGFLIPFETVMDFVKGTSRR